MNKLQFKLVFLVLLFLGVNLVVCLSVFTDIFTLNRVNGGILVICVIIIAVVTRPDKDLTPAIKSIDPGAESEEAKAKRTKYIFWYFLSLIIISFSMIITGTAPKSAEGGFALIYVLLMGPILLMFLLAAVKYYGKLKNRN